MRFKRLQNYNRLLLMNPRNIVDVLASASESEVAKNAGI